MAMALAHTHPTFFRDHHRHGFIDDFDLGHRFFLGLNQGTSLIGKQLGVGFDFFDHQSAQRRCAA
jgi:hypothetical protein